MKWDYTPLVRTVSVGNGIYELEQFPQLSCLKTKLSLPCLGCNLDLMLSSVTKTFFRAFFHDNIKAWSYSFIFLWHLTGKSEIILNILEFFGTLESGSIIRWLKRSSKFHKVMWFIRYQQFWWWEIRLTHMLISPVLMDRLWVLHELCFVGVVCSLKRLLDLNLVYQLRHFLDKLINSVNKPAAATAPQVVVIQPTLSSF